MERQFEIQDKDRIIRTFSNFREEVELSSGNLGQWEIKTIERRLILPENIEVQAKNLLGKWINAFPREETWIQNSVGIPSLLVRFDGVDMDGELGVYEIEERPAGVGHTIMINSSFARNLDSVSKTWPDFDVVISPKRDPADDKLWRNVVSLEDSKGLAYVRAEPDETEFAQLRSRSVSTISTEGDKSYGVDLGLWKFVDDPKQFPERESFVLKPMQGSKGKEMVFYIADKNPIPGNSRMKNVCKKLEEQVEKNGGMYLQKLIPPMQSGFDKYPYMIYRFFFGFNFDTGQWESLGGTYFVRNNVKIHGASDSLSGALVVKK